FTNVNPIFSSNFTTFIDSVDKDEFSTDQSTIYPGRPLVMSLVIPGLGQVYNKDSWLKVGLFSGIEITSLAAYFNFVKQADQIQMDYEAFADNNWSLDKWVWDSIELQNMNSNFPDVIIDGTHSLLIFLTGELATAHGVYISSDSLEAYPFWVDEEGVAVIRDRDFYENIGKYDQFVAGWSDFDVNAIQTIEKDVGDSIEILVTTDFKDKYLDMRFDSNNYLKMANYAMTAVLFNHVWSAIDAVFIANKRRHNNTKQVKTDVGLLYDHRSKSGIGGISLTVQF
ncbi:MAG: hypothetical protein HQ509_06530, partial [Candidatus Marinimicrobia bacterium]|nr:hypothetical protein [Candidatus Neomarinimicrobiota bacterium]